MAWVMVRNEGESYLYTYLRSGTGTTAEYPPVLPVPRNPTITDNLPGILWEKTYRYYRAFTGTTGQQPVLQVQPPVLPLEQFTAKTSFAGNRLTGTIGLSPVPPVKIGTTGKPPVPPLEQKLAELKHWHRRDLCLPVLPVVYRYYRCSHA
jgi:hypothetical protein